VPVAEFWKLVIGEPTCHAQKKYGRDVALRRIIAP
jgi:hypothetical protein